MTANNVRVEKEINQPNLLLSPSRPKVFSQTVTLSADRETQTRADTMQLLCADKEIAYFLCDEHTTQTVQSQNVKYSHV